ncbi:hypothetical protein [Cupriavidus taiwanensis]|uniref:Uncharacterized protein n=1 Tax=Cupriavidus taiwanensis (strain DSM 17343 / BCRC 17206 / CCUG 44338 / CIP 107171 / LMG 19424 / R1) TaxID=977880 RepID=B3R8N1_CUPTR|nr:hypothetical protein [Cupriavidus taiwanensis]CAQ71149.1 hypothetical protein RALTA_B0528 [Cupriavidus taiwanensis LMG 19424]
MTAQDISVTTVNRRGETVTGSGVARGDATASLIRGASGNTERPQTLGMAGGGLP